MKMGPKEEGESAETLLRFGLHWTGKREVSRPFGTEGIFLITPPNVETLGYCQ